MKTLESSFFGYEIAAFFPTCIIYMIKLVEEFVMFNIDPWLIQRMNPIPYFPKWGRLKENKQLHSLKDESIVIDNPDNYLNHLEMSGQQISTIVTYGVFNGKLKISRHLAFPNVRSRIVHTRNNMRINIEKSLTVLDGNHEVLWQVERIAFDGKLTFYCRYKNLKLEWTMMPSMTEKVFIETFKFIGDVTGFKLKPYHHHYKTKCFRKCKLVSQTLACSQICDLESRTYYQYHGQELVELNPLILERSNFLDDLSSSLILESPDEALNYFFNLTKIRTCESVFKTKSGYMHSPGGGSYYGGMWTNDECEYTNPLFGYMNYPLGQVQSINGFKMFSKYLDQGALPSSIICEGDGIKGVAGDRGDTAMFAYGLGRFLLSYSDRALALEMLPHLEKALSYCLNNRHESGVILSDSDELENRLPSGQTNLFTSSLVYDALLSMHYLLDSLDKSSDYLNDAEKLHLAIEDYFGKNINGYRSYRYCEEDDDLRSWAVVPIVMGIKERSKDVLKLIFSKFMHHDKGLKSSLSHDIVWDRSLLYALRAAFIGEMPSCEEKLKDYVTTRMLGSHIPYPIEAYPEGNQKHLSGESALFMRVITEGLFGYRPIGIGKVMFKPHLPASWMFANLKNMSIDGRIVDVSIKRSESYTLTLIENGEIIYEHQGNAFEVSF